MLLTSSQEDGLFRALLQSVSISGHLDLALCKKGTIFLLEDNKLLVDRLGILCNSHTQGFLIHEYENNWVNLEEKIVYVGYAVWYLMNFPNIILLNY